MSDVKIKIIDGVRYQLNEYDWCSYNKSNHLHSFDDKPAVISSTGSKFWYKNGLCHRDNDKPATIYSNGTKYWFKNGQIHRDNDKPAIIYSSGGKEWYVDDKRQMYKHFTCFYIKNGEQYKKFFITEYEAKEYEADMLSKNICAWVIENV